VKEKVYSGVTPFGSYAEKFAFIRLSNSEVGKEETEKESQESMWAEVINDARWYNGSPHDLQQLTNHFRNVRNFEIRRKNPTV
jgi:L,D-peptidoglycan transpeptidase YkuD (ErfK/YbiS/YcfS/YnhG family)